MHDLHDIKIQDARSANIALNTLTTTTWSIQEQSIYSSTKLGMSPTSGNSNFFLHLRPAGTSTQVLIQISPQSATSGAVSLFDIGANSSTEFALHTEAVGGGTVLPIMPMPGTM